jgi:two-component system, NtrC family, nitrogen regulation sensor histidine kinase NtrY
MHRRSNAVGRSATGGWTARGSRRHVARVARLIPVASVRPAAASRSIPRPGAGAARRPFRDNPRLILAGIAILVVVLAGILVLAERTSRLAPDFLAEFVLYALSATNIMMLLALGFVLARNIVKLLVERRRAIPFVRFRAKLVFTLLGMTLVPTVLVLFVGSNVVLRAVDQWFNEPVDEVLASANQIAADYYRERQQSVSGHAARLSGVLSSADLGSADLRVVRDQLTRDVNDRRVGLVQVYRTTLLPNGQLDVIPVVDVAAPTMPQVWPRASADRLAVRVASGVEAQPWMLDEVPGGGDLMRAAHVIRNGAREVTGVVVASDYLSGDLAERSRQMTKAYEDYTQLRVLRLPLAGVYLSFFVMVTLLILVSSTWMGFYLAKRITRPVQMLSVAAREIAQGRYDQRIEHVSTDEFGSMIEAFNAMAAELASSRRRLERAAIDLERKNHEAEGRRRYIETILERVATGVMSIDPAGRIGTINAAAMRLLEIDADVVGQAAVDVFGRADLQPINGVLDQAARARSDAFAQEVAIIRDGRGLHAAVAVTRLTGANGEYEGSVLVLDDVTPLVRAQKVAAWREVARRLAHEIKNPLTPIQLSAERMRRKLAGLDQPHGDLVQECTTTIIGEVESLKNLVDEFSQFARMPAPRATPTDLHQLLADALSLYDGLFTEVRIERQFGTSVPQVRVDPEQIRRVVINLVDNAVEAIDRRGTITIETAHDRANSLVRVTIADDGPGIPPEERDKLFLPYYSTKGRGSGLGLAIVRRIVAEHGGSIDVSNNIPRGTRFTIELPA